MLKKLNEKPQYYSFQLHEFKVALIFFKKISLVKIWTGTNEGKNLFPEKFINK